MLAQLPEALREPPAQLGLAACLQALLAPETLEGENAYSCDACAAQAKAKAEAAAETAAAAGATAADAQEEPGGASSAASLSLAASASASASAKTGQPALKWLQVARTPRALTLHLKRFRWMGRKVGPPPPPDPPPHPPPPRAHPYPYHSPKP